MKMVRIQFIKKNSFKVEIEVTEICEVKSVI